MPWSKATAQETLIERRTLHGGPVAWFPQSGFHTNPFLVAGKGLVFVFFSQGLWVPSPKLDERNQWHTAGGRSCGACDGSCGHDVNWLRT